MANQKQNTKTTRQKAKRRSPSHIRFAIQQRSKAKSEKGSRKACDNNTQTIPNNMVLWQRAGTLQSATRPRDPAVPLHLQKRCCLLKLRQFLAKKGHRHIGFLDSPEVVLPSIHIL
jgi:hypothetical protein